MAVGNKAEGGRDGENQACKRPGRARDGAQQDRAEAKAGVDNEATREGEETPELDPRDRTNIEATGCITPVTTKEEENPGRGGDTKEDEGSREEEEARYQSDQVPQDRQVELLSNLSGDGTCDQFQVGATSDARYHEPVRSWDSENGGNEEDNSRYLQLIGDGTRTTPGTTSLSGTRTAPRSPATRPSCSRSSRTSSRST